MNANPRKIGIAITDASLAPLAQQLADQWQWPLIQLPDPHYEFALIYTPQGLQLAWLTQPKWKPIQVEFAHRPDHRQQTGGAFSQLLAKACGLKPNQPSFILDVTAGLGRDAWILAHLGAHVTLIERSAIMAALLADGLNRLPPSSRIYNQLTLIQTDAQPWLNERPPAEYDVIYLDPMHPPRSKSALVKKEMRMIRALVGDDSDAAKLLAVANTKARRVVVKLPRHAESLLTMPPPTLQYTGRSIRYDVYLHTI